MVLDRSDRLPHERIARRRCNLGRGDRTGSQGREAHPPPASAGTDARRHVDGHDQRLLRPAVALSRSASPSTRSTRPGSIDRTKTVSDQRVDDAFRFVKDRGVTFHWQEEDAADFTAAATREQLRGYLAVLDLLAEFKADCVGWQYQLGLLKLLPPSDFAEGLLNSHAGPKATATS